MIRNAVILTGILSVVKKCNIKSYPIDCFKIIREYGYTIRKYSELNDKKQIACKELSEDAVTIERTIYYNESMPHSRIRFSLLHELGHIVLSTEDEVYANAFASHLLAPRLIMYYSGCQNISDIMTRFDVSEQAANYAYNDYIRWKSTECNTECSSIEKELYEHFYDKELDRFIWKKEKCSFCYSSYVYNEEKLCYDCRIYEIRKKYSIKPQTDEREKALDLLRGNWLYGNL